MGASATTSLLLVTVILVLSTSVSPNQRANSTTMDEMNEGEARFLDKVLNFMRPVSSRVGYEHTWPVSINIYICSVFLCFYVF